MLNTLATRGRGRAVRLAALVLVLGTSQIAAAAPARANGLDFMTAPDEAGRDRTIDHLAMQTRDGLTMLARWYISGEISPVPDPMPAEFLYLRSVHSGQPAWRDAALAMTGSWATIHLNDYLTRGVADSTRVDLRAAAGMPRRVKTLGTQAGLLRLFTMAWQASGKEMFRKAALRTGSDLAGWGLVLGSTGDDSVMALAWTSVDPDTLTGPAATAAESAAAATALAEAAVVFQQPHWAPAWLTRLVPEPAPVEAPTLPPATPADTMAATHAALELTRYANWTHAESLLVTAAAWLEPLRLDAASETRDMPLFAARAAAAMALELAARPSVMAYIVGDPALPETMAMRDAAVSAFRPGHLVQVRGADASDLLYPASGDGRPLAYVCSGELCAPPTSDASEVSKLVGSFALPESSEPPDAPGP